MLLIAEILTLVASARHILLSGWGENEDIASEAREYATRALTLGSLTFAAIALLVSAFPTTLSELTDTFLVLGVSLGLFFVSYSFEVLTLRHRLYWVIQDKALTFGYLSAVVALLVFFWKILPALLPVMIPVTVILFSIHAYEFTQDLSKWKQRESELTGAEKDKRSERVREVPRTADSQVQMGGDHSDLERMKVQFYWDYKRSGAFATLTAVFSGFAAAMVILTSLRVSNLIDPFLQTSAVLVVFLVFAYDMVRGVRIPLRSLVIRTDELLKEMGETGKVKTLAELLEVKTPVSAWKEYANGFLSLRVVIGLLIGVFILAVLVLL